MKELAKLKKEQLLFIGTAKQKVVGVIFNFPEKEFSLSELARQSGVKKSNIGAILKELEKEGIIEIIRLANLFRIKANQKSDNYIQRKIVYNLHLILDSGIVRALQEKYHPKSIILFGSYRKGDDISTSDIDIALETYDKKYNIIEFKDFEKILSKKIQLHMFNRKFIDLNLFNNIANGIVLGGFLEVGL